mmetsp:Transcript_52230/g.154156  ORF Transcript_52230/g.154156 Transcript_52230/m.154156 type:complete len:401 (-) Transcript_52230:13-1215(-)
MRWRRAALALAFLGAAQSAPIGLKAAIRAPFASLEAALAPDRPAPEFIQAESSLEGRHEEATCSLVANGPVCYGGQRATLVPNAAVPGLIGHWTFDEQDPIDSSGNGNHGVSDVTHGPSPTGGGHSALFRNNFLTVPNTWHFKTQDFSYSLWVYLLDDGAGSKADEPRWCPLLRKGVYVSKAEEFANAPAVSFSRLTGRLRISVTTSVSGYGDGEFVDSNARLQVNRWVHLALVHHSAKRRMIVYVNGIPDAVLSMRGDLQQNEYPLYVGGDPFTADQCQHAVYIDELRAYNRPVAPHEIQAEAAPALAGVDPSLVRLGCTDCALSEAVAKCPKHRHLCTALELHTGGYQVALALGWLMPGKHVWSHAAIARTTAAAGLGPGPHGEAQAVGLGLCCEGED